MTKPTVAQIYECVKRQQCLVKKETSSEFLKKILSNDNTILHEDSIISDSSNENE